MLLFYSNCIYRTDILVIVYMFYSNSRAYITFKKKNKE